MLCLLYFPANRLVVLYSSFKFLFDVASSACLAKLPVPFVCSNTRSDFSVSLRISLVCCDICSNRPTVNEQYLLWL